MPKGEKVLDQSKRTAPPCQFQNFSKQSLNVLKCSSIVIFENSISIGKTLLNNKRRISLRGSFCLVKGKAFEIGEKISNLENASQNLIHLPLTICKKTLKRISKIICKNKTSGASVVQNVKLEESIHAYLMKCILV
jgi:hypothetical protein